MLTGERTVPGIASENYWFRRHQAAYLPVAGAGIDTLISLQVIEHVWDHRQFLAECARVLRPGGLLILSTPNRLTFSPGTDRPVNPFHTHEFTAAELCRLVAGNGLTVVAARGLFAGPRLVELDRRHAAAGGLVAAQLAGPPEHWPAGLAAEVAGIG